ncbi:TERF1-interacting nuclear factor 2 isoform X4 [Poecile atricapillus]|uniref:TERF1-interacting nuclear factor 2 isoform X4 n=1 Tax=Poecile atricapillus TaxID=48891 RepID=UPI0027399B16|nr:TERF1-interacting nuclear factor 2 isoform X4 [Poecile atricapillus]
MSGSDVSPSPSLRLAMAGAWWALRGRGLGGRGLDGRGLDGRGLDGRGWGRLLALLEAVGGGAPALLRPRHRARLSLGLRAQVVTSLLRELGPSPAVLDALDWLFPEGAGPAAGHALGEYGPRFRNSLGNLFLEFLLRLESALPPPDLAQLDALCRSHAPPGFRTRPLPILRRYWAEVGHAHPAPVPRPIPARKTTPMVKPRPQRRRLRPLRFSPYHADGKGDRDRHRTHGQGGADQGARGGEGRDPPPAAAADLQREANER